MRHYLYLEQRRFQARLKVVYIIEADGFLVPALSLQPPAENAVRHGILKNEEGGVVTVRSREEGGLPSGAGRGQRHWVPAGWATAGSGRTLPYRDRKRAGPAGTYGSRYAYH